MKRSVVIVTDRRIMPPWGGNRVRILELIRSLRGLGQRVSLISNETEYLDELRAEVNDLFIIKAGSFNGGDLRNFNVQPFRRALERVVTAERPSVVIAEYAWLASAMRSLPKSVMRWVDCHDLLHERMTRFRAAGLDPWTICTLEQELRLLNYADVLITTQQRETEVLKRLLPGKKVVCLLPSIDLPEGFQRSSSNIQTVLAVGARHAGNDGISRFARELWRDILARVPHARLQIVGAISEEVALQPGIEFTGHVVDMHAYYNSAAVVICPILVGTGVKIKMVEALRLGKAVVATGVAAEGLPSPERRSWLMVESLSECADAVVTLLTSREARAELEDAAFEYGQRYLSAECSQNRLRSMLPGSFKLYMNRLLDWA